MQLDLHFIVCIFEHQPSPGLWVMLSRSGFHSGSWSERGKILKTDKFWNVGSGGAEKSEGLRMLDLFQWSHRLLPAQRQHVITICCMKQVLLHFIAVKQHRWMYIKFECEEDTYTLPSPCPGCWTKWWSSKHLCETSYNQKCIGVFSRWRQGFWWSARLQDNLSLVLSHFLCLHLYDTNCSRVCPLTLKNWYALAKPFELLQLPNRDAAMQTAYWDYFLVALTSEPWPEIARDKVLGKIMPNFNDLAIEMVKFPLSLICYYLIY